MSLRFLMTAIAATAAASGIAAADIADFSFTDRDGKLRTFFEVIDAAPDGASVYLLLFDPDCNECKDKIDALRDDRAIASGIADGSVKVVAVYPVEEKPAPSDPNLEKYLQVSPTLPEGWTVGIDNGSIFEGDFYQWDTLPLIIRYKKTEDLTGRTPESLTDGK